MWTIAKIYAVGGGVLLAFAAVQEACEWVTDWLDSREDD